MKGSKVVHEANILLFMLSPDSSDQICALSPTLPHFLPLSSALLLPVVPPRSSISCTPSFPDVDELRGCRHPVPQMARGKGDQVGIQHENRNIESCVFVSFSLYTRVYTVYYTTVVLDAYFISWGATVVDLLLFSCASCAQECCTVRKICKTNKIRAADSAAYNGI